MKFSEQTEPNRQNSQNYINSRWRGFQQDVGAALSRIVDHLFILNAGAVVGCITYLAAKAANQGIKCALWFFIVGLICILFRAALDYYICEYLFRAFRKDVRSYYDDKLDWVALREIDTRRKAPDWLAHLLGWISGIGFISGIILGAISLP